MNYDEPWFVAKDVCDILGLNNVTKALSPLDDDERSNFKLRRQGKTNIISESGLYALIFKSRKPGDRKFQKWVTSEVPPAVRKIESYSRKQPQLIPLRERGYPLKMISDMRVAQLNETPIYEIATRFGIHSVYASQLSRAQYSPSEILSALKLYWDCCAFDFLHGNDFHHDVIRREMDGE